jgi:phospholipid/cholesterol/gamma-HCH transport system permease protein
MSSPRQAEYGVAPTLARLGSRARRHIRSISNKFRFAIQSAGVMLRLPALGIGFTWRVILNQVRFTGVQALPFLAFVSAVVSVLIVIQVLDQATWVGFETIIGTVFVAGLIREMGPLLTAVVVIGRSGTAIAAELGTNRVMEEITALETMGIDPLHYVVFPRLVGVTIATICLVIFFDGIALFFGFIAAQLTTGMGFTTFLRYIIDELTMADLYVTGLKGLLFGIIIALLPSFHGLVVRQVPTEVPKAVTRAVVECLALVFLVSAIVSMIFYY